MPVRRNDPVGSGYPVPQNLRVDQENDPDEVFGVSEESTFTLRPDPDDHRRSKVNFEPLERDDEFPYDEPDRTYGAPNTSYGSAPHSKTRTFEIVPKNTEHTTWDDLEEIVGYPALLSKAYDSQVGSSIPGVNGWANDPPKDWDENELEEDFDPKVPPTETPLDHIGAHFHNKTDDEVEKKLERIWGIGDNPNAYVVKKSEPADVCSSWDELDMIHGDSAWGDLVKVMMAKDLMNRQSNRPTSVVIRAGEASDEDHDE
jgi:hypothetical protein